MRLHGAQVLSAGVRLTYIQKRTVLVIENGRWNEHNSDNKSYQPCKDATLGVKETITRDARQPRLLGLHGGVHSCYHGRRRGNDRW